MKVFECPFDKEVSVIIIYGDDAEYEQLAPHFEENIAFTPLGSELSLIVIDGKATEEEWFSDEHLLVVMAHEMGHIRNNSVDEMDADLTGFDLLADSGLSESAVSLYALEIQARYAGPHPTNLGKQ